MKQLICRPCLAFEALASLVFCNYCRDDVPKIKEWVESTFQGINIGPSNQFFDLLAAHHTLEEIESFNVEKLAEVYPLYIHELSYTRRYEAELLKGLGILRNSDYMELWNSDVLPILSRQCEEASSCISDTKVHDVLSDVSRVHQKEMNDDIYIYITYFTHPVSFKTAPNSYITNFGINSPIHIKYFLRLLAHELCHGFSNEKARGAYRAMCGRDKYLNKTNWFFDEFCAHPGDEEEFVQAIENAIAVKNGLETYVDVINHFYGYYKCSVPIAIILFTELYKLECIPADMNEWIYAKFNDQTIKSGEIETKVNTIIPGYTDRFRKIWKDEEQKDPVRFSTYKSFTEGTMPEPFKSFSAVFPIILDTTGDNPKILLHRRQNTGYQDGKWDIAGSGHVDKGETARMAAARECKEELGIDLNVEDLTFVHLTHRFSGRTYYDIYFVVEKYEGTPAIMEPEKSSALEWFDAEKLPEDMIECRRTAVSTLRARNSECGKGNYYSEYLE